MAGSPPSQNNNQNQDPSRKKKNQPEPKKPWGFLFWLMLFLIVMVIFKFSENAPLQNSNELTLKDLKKDLIERDVRQVVFDMGSAEVLWELGEGSLSTNGKKKAVASKIPDELRSLIDEKTPNGLRYVKPGFWQMFLMNWGPWLFLIILFYFFFFRQFKSGGAGNLFSFGKSRATLIHQENINKTFKDVAGVDEAKEELAEIVEFLKAPEKFTKLGGRLPRGVLLNGPPGTGKTLLAKAIAGEAGVPFFSISGSDFVEMFVGVGASRVRDLFYQAKENSPSIIFLDEIDAVGRRRGSGLGGGHDEREQTLNAILVEMDGFDSDEGVIVIASTNRVDVLDPALLRPGRFDRHVSVGLPDIEGRKAILKVHAKKVKLSSDVKLEVVAQSTTGFSGADLENLLNEAALIAVAQNKPGVEMSDMFSARDKIAFGKARKSKVIHTDDLKITAYHEAGHAVCSLNCPGMMKLEKTTIIPIGNAAGANFYRPERDDEHVSRKKLIGEIVKAYGGRVAEELFFEDITTGASNDIKQATSIARQMVTEWGMSSKSGLVNYKPSEERMFLGGEITRSKSYSESTADLIDTEIKRILDECYQESKSIIEKDKDALIRIAEALLVYETLSADEVEKLAAGEKMDREPPVNLVITRVDADGKKNNRNNEASEDSADEKSEGPDGDDDGPHIDTAV